MSKRLPDISFDPERCCVMRGEAYADLTEQQAKLFTILLLQAQSGAGPMTGDALAQLAGGSMRNLSLRVTSLRLRLKRVRLDIVSRKGPGGGYQLADVAPPVQATDRGAA